jgi:hypothetical protein
MMYKRDKLENIVLINILGVFVQTLISQIWVNCHSRTTGIPFGHTFLVTDAPWRAGISSENKRNSG